MVGMRGSEFQLERIGDAGPSYFPRINGVSAEGLWGGIRG
jgi:hypothetical protein